MNGYIDKYGISYKVEGEGKPMILLHGDDSNKEVFNFVMGHYRSKYQVFSFDLPGFGKSKFLNLESPDRFAEVMLDICRELAISKPVGLGHGIGGQVLLRMTLHLEFQALILTGVVGYVQRPLYITYKKSGNLNKAVLMNLVRKIDFIGIGEKIQGIRYGHRLVIKRLCTSGLIRKVFPKGIQKYLPELKVNIDCKNNTSSQLLKLIIKFYTEDITEVLKNNKVPTLLIWGEEDKKTPLDTGRYMEFYLEDAGLILFEESGHFAFIEQSQRLLVILDAFI